MTKDSEKVSLIMIRTVVSSCEITQDPPLKVVKNENIPETKNVETSEPLQRAESRKVTTGTTAQINDAIKIFEEKADLRVYLENETVLNALQEDRQRTGRYLAVGVTLIMLFIAFYHTILRHATVLAGLLAPAIIMLLYILWLLYFAKKRKTQSENENGQPKDNGKKFPMRKLI